MIQHVTAIYEHGFLKPLTPLDLKEQEVVELSIGAANSHIRSADSNGQTLYDVMAEAGLIGCIEDGSPDLSVNPKYMEGFGTSGE